MTATMTDYVGQRRFLKLCVEAVSAPHYKRYESMLRDDLRSALKNIAESETAVLAEDPYFVDPITGELRKQGTAYLNEVR